MELVNRVAQSGIITINLENYYPKEEIIEFDLKDFLFMEMILKEKDFRLKLKELDWAQYEGKIVLVYCSADAVIPVWAYMLVSSYLAQYGSFPYGMTKEEFLKHHYRTIIDTLDIESYAEQRIVIKGCSEKPVPPSAYLDMQRRLTGLSQSVMYGEPCSTVPIYKQPRKLVRE